MKPASSGTEFSRVVAVARRDLRIQLTYPLQTIMLLAEAPFAVFTYFFIGRLVGEPAPLAAYGAGYFEFALIGFIVMSFATVALSAFSQGIAAEQSLGTLEVVLASAEARLGTLLSGALVVPIGLAAIQGAVLLILAGVVSDVGFDVGGVLLALPLVALTVVTFCAFGIVTAAAIVVLKRGDPVSMLLLQASSLVGGALFPVALLPGPLRSAARFVPAFYGFNGVREVFLAHGGLHHVAGELAVLALFAAVLLPLSLWLFRWAVQLGRVSGTLGTS